jgi:hypothetical protein
MINNNTISASSSVVHNDDQPQMTKEPPLSIITTTTTTDSSGRSSELQAPSISSSSSSSELCEKQQIALDSSMNQKSKVIGDYLVGDTIGKGTFGKVKIGIHLLTGEKVAIKILEKHKIVEVADVERVTREIKILRKNQHINVIQVYLFIYRINISRKMILICDCDILLSYLK